MNSPAVTTTKEGRLIDHGNALETPFNALFLRLTLFLPIISILFIDIRESATLQEFSYRASTAPAKHELGFVYDLPKTDRFVSPADADRGFCAQRIEVEDTILMAK